MPCRIKLCYPIGIGIAMLHSIHRQMLDVNKAICRQNTRTLWAGRRLFPQERALSEISPMSANGLARSYGPVFGEVDPSADFRLCCGDAIGAVGFGLRFSTRGRAGIKRSRGWSVWLWRGIEGSLLTKERLGRRSASRLGRV